MEIHFRLGPDEPGFIIGGIHCRLLHRLLNVTKTNSAQSHLSSLQHRLRTKHTNTKSQNYQEFELTGTP